MVHPHWLKLVRRALVRDNPAALSGLVRAINRGWRICCATRCGGGIGEGRNSLIDTGWSAPGWSRRSGRR
jgi:hypothetical protein